MEFGGWFLLIGMDYFCDCLRTVLEALITYKFVLKKKTPNTGKDRRLALRERFGFGLLGMIT